MKIHIRAMVSSIRQLFAAIKSLFKLVNNMIQYLFISDYTMKHDQISSTPLSPFTFN